MPRKKFFRRSGGRRYKRSRGRRGHNLGLASIGVAANAAVQLGIPDAVESAFAGDFKGAFNRLGQQSAGDILFAAGPAIGLGIMRKFIGRIPLFKLGSWQINLL